MKVGDKVDIEFLVKKAKKGDKESLIQLVMAEKNEYYKLAYVYMKNKDDALDAMQDMILILYDNIHKLREENSFYSWSKTILVNRCKKKIKENKKLVPLDKIKEGINDEIYTNSEEKIVLEKYLEKLNYKHEEVIRLKYFLDLDYKKISEILNIPLGTVKSRLNIGMKKLREIIGGEVIE